MENKSNSSSLPDDKQFFSQENTSVSSENKSQNEILINTEEKINPETTVNEVNLRKKNPAKEKPKPVSKSDMISETDNIEPIQQEDEIIIPQVQYENLNKEELVSHLEEIIKVTDTFATKAQVGLIKAAFHKIQKEEKQHLIEEHIAKGGTPENFFPEENELEKRFTAAFSIYKENKIKQESDLETEKQNNLLEKQKILDDIKNLVDSEEELKKTYDAFKNLQERWKIIGQVPQKEKNDLWQSYHFLVEKFFAKLKINKELKDLDLKKNLEIKIDLCEKTEELMLESSITKSFQLLQNYHDTWKETGPVPPDKKEEIWQRFSNATEKINQRRDEFYLALKEEQENNFIAKSSLCDKVEQINNLTYNTPKEWQTITDEINEIQKNWKTIGYAPKKVNNEVWDRFRKAINVFFQKKKDFFSKVKDDQTENYNQKINLCIQAEALKNNSNWKKTTDELIKLQQEWKKIGPVPKKYSDKIWKRFRAACDEFFNNKTAYFSNIDKIEEDNLKLKEDLIKRINDYPYDTDNKANFEIIKAFQREWFEIGHVPMKSKDAIQNSYNDTINKLFDKLKISAQSKVSLNYKSKLDNIKNQPDAKHIVYKEINFISTKINTLRNELKLLENNIGFLAQSKNADILKAEFDKKIINSKNEILMLEEKLKMLREMDKQ